MRYSQKGSEPSTPHEEQRENSIFQLQLLVTRDTRQHPGKIGKKEQWVNEDSYQSQHSQVSICGAWLREERKISLSFLSKFRLESKNIFKN